MKNARPTSTPLPTSPTLSFQSDTTLSDPSTFCTIVGSLQYLTLTRPDVAYAVIKLSQYMHHPTSDHWTVVKCILRYLCCTIDHGILFHRQSPLQLHAYSVIDWVSYKDDFTSTSAFLLDLNRNPISWSSKKQCTIARSSTEAEYQYVVSMTTELRWVSNLLNELDLSSTRAPVIYYDNVGTTNLCSNPVFHLHMKHVALYYHFFREQVQIGYLHVAHVAFANQLADALTKPLPRTRFHLLLLKIYLSSQSSNLRGHIGESGSTSK